MRAWVLPGGPALPAAARARAREVRAWVLPGGPALPAAARARARAVTIGAAQRRVGVPRVAAAPPGARVASPHGVDA